ncbi:RPE65 domain-containing protein [Cephalotus follicularis]|uniref:RPE65 domain-containing protein n=1 Tax=Cephalotus follicularis TaxID=3775 RepID=A0A1Q3BHW5_CEPFO|nr:RPE65 domain-containing protein [Cephalotus follicularis]
MEAMSSTFFSPTIILKKSNRVSPPRNKIISSMIEYKSHTTNNIPSSATVPLMANKGGGAVVTKLLNDMEDIVNKSIDPPSQPSLDPKQVLSNIFAPVGELPPTECEVIQGSLPPCLDGAYIRNGPNPQFFPQGPYHLYEGDGMIHCIRISQGRATFCSRYVKTYKFNSERHAGCPIVPNFLSSFNGGLIARAARVALFVARALISRYNLLNGFGTANTGLAVFGNRLFAVGEADLPYRLRLTPSGDVETLGRHDFDGRLLMSMTAHPKMDPDTGETFAFRYNTQMTVKPIQMYLRGDSLIQSDPSKVPRIGIIPRYAKNGSELRWFEIPGFNNAHAINAWDEEDGEAIVMIAPNMLAIEHSFDRMELNHNLMEKVRVDLKTGTISRHPLSARNLDIAVINQGYIAKKNRYVYAAVGGPFPKVIGVVKLDLSKGEQQECIVASRMYGPESYGGEPFFVAREPENPNAEEDDGYIVSYVHHEKLGESRFLVMDAKSLDIVAAVKLPRRVPSGFHGIFVKESELDKIYSSVN